MFSISVPAPPTAAASEPPLSIFFYVPADPPGYVLECLASWQKHHAQLVVDLTHPSQPLRCQALYDAISDPIGKMNILKWEHLYKHGGIFVESDVYLLNALHPELLAPSVQFVSFKNEVAAPSMLSSAVVKFRRGDALLHRMIETMLAYDVHRINEAASWITVGNGLLSLTWQAMKGEAAASSLRILPSYLFTPFYAEQGMMYNGHGKIFAVQLQDHQLLVSDAEDDLEEEVPEDDIQQIIHRFVETPLDIENDEHAWCQLVIVGGKNPDIHSASLCFQYILAQHGALLFGVEVIWIDDPATSPAIRKALQEAVDTICSLSRNCVAHIYKPSFPVDGLPSVQRAMDRVHVLFPDRDVILQFYLQGALKSLQNPRFCAEKMQEIISGDAPEEDDDDR